MKFNQLSEYLNKLEQTAKRTEMTAILTELIVKLNPNEIKNTTYLIMGNLSPAFENKKFNIADKMMIRVLEAAYNSKKVTELYKDNGDLGDTAFRLANDSKAVAVEINTVYDKLWAIANTSGAGSQETKVKLIAQLLNSLDPLSAKYVTRIILGTTRLGFTELTFIDALAQFIGDKKLAEQIEKIYYIHPDIGLIAQQIKNYGIKGITKIEIEPGVPVLSQKAQRLSSSEEAIEKMGAIWVEYKFDGTRVQLHVDHHKLSASNTNAQEGLFNTSNKEILIKTFTRNLEETSHQFPDIAEAAKKQIDASAVILDGEAIGYDKKTGEFLPFQETIQRKRKHGVVDSAKLIPLRYFVFDILFLNGKSLTELPLSDRHAILEKIIKPGEVITVVEHAEASTEEELQNYYEIAKKKRLEGVIAKKPQSVYQAGGRSYAWVKLKRADEKLLEDSIDCVVLGYYSGKGTRSKFGIGGFLAGVYDTKSDSFKTITKVGTGLTEDDFAKLKNLCDKYQSKELPKNVDMDKIYTPDVFTLPKIVVELGADEISDSPTHSAGYALRFPRLLNFRTDKNPTESTSVEEVKQMYKKQKRAKY